MDCIENAAFPDQSDEEINRLLHMVVVGGGPTGVEYAAELYDFLHQDLVCKLRAHERSNGTPTLRVASKLRSLKPCPQSCPCLASS